MSSVAAREAIATALRDALPEGWTVYPWPNVQAGERSAIVGPGSPYRAPLTFGGIHESTRLRITLLTQVAGGQQSFDMMDAAFDDVATALEAATVEVTWAQADMPGTVVNNTGVEYFAASMDIEVLG